MECKQNVSYYSFIHSFFSNFFFFFPRIILVTTFSFAPIHYFSSSSFTLLISFSSSLFLPLSLLLSITSRLSPSLSFLFTDCFLSQSSNFFHIPFYSFPLSLSYLYPLLCHPSSYFLVSSLNFSPLPSLSPLILSLSFSPLLFSRLHFSPLTPEQLFIGWLSTIDYWIRNVTFLLARPPTPTPPPTHTNTHTLLLPAWLSLHSFVATHT